MTQCVLPGFEVDNAAHILRLREALHLADPTLTGNQAHSPTHVLACDIILAGLSNTMWASCALTMVCFDCCELAVAMSRGQA
jgi:hypothetical protein